MIENVNIPSPILCPQVKLTSLKIFCLVVQFVRQNYPQRLAMKRVRLKTDSLSHVMSEVNSTHYNYLQYSTCFIAFVSGWPNSPHYFFSLFFSPLCNFTMSLNACSCPSLKSRLGTTFAICRFCQINTQSLFSVTL